MEIFRFLEWKVYKDAKTLFFESLKIVHALPKEHRFEIGGQLVRSSLSVVLNIAEGSGRKTSKDMAHFFDIAIGSLNETLACLDVLKDCGFIKDAGFSKIKDLISEISRQLGGFKKRL